MSKTQKIEALESPVDESKQTENPEEENLKREEIIEVPWELTENVFLVKKELTRIETFTSEMMLSYEKRKSSLLDQITNLEHTLYSEASKLRDSLNIDPAVTYELKIPESAEEKAYFVRKDEQ